VPDESLGNSHNNLLISASTSATAGGVGGAAGNPRQYCNITAF
jgi:hypothetical protein